jgi:hypothetical protein
MTSKPKQSPGRFTSLDAGKWVPIQFVLRNSLASLALHSLEPGATFFAASARQRCVSKS